MTINKSDQLCTARAELRVVLFDVGGVLVELAGVSQMLAWLEHRLSIEELWQRWLESPAVRAFETGRSNPESFACGVLDEFQLSGTPGDFIEAFRQWPTRLYPGTVDLLARVAPRYKRALLSNSNELHWSRISDDMQLGRLVEHHFVSHLTGRIKPDADAFTHVLATLGCPASAVLFLDDNLINVSAATQLGMQARVVQGVEQLTVALNEFGVLADE